MQLLPNLKLSHRLGPVGPGTYVNVKLRFPSFQKFFLTSKDVFLRFFTANYGRASGTVIGRKNGQISKLVGTTKPTIQAIKERTHWNSPNLVAQDPVTLGLCSQRELDAVVAKAAKRAGIEAPEAVEGDNRSDKEKLIEELRAERVEAEKAANEAAQEAEAEAWLEAKRAAEAGENADGAE